MLARMFFPPISTSLTLVACPFYCYHVGAFVYFPKLREIWKRLSTSVHLRTQTPMKFCLNSPTLETCFEFLWRIPRFRQYFVQNVVHAVRVQECIGDWR